MSREELLAEYEAACKAKAKAEVAIKVLKFKAELLFGPNELAKPSTVEPVVMARTAREELVADHAEKLTSVHFSHMELRSRPAAEVADFLCISKAEVYRLMEQGVLQAGAGDKPGRGGKRMVCTVSSVKWDVGLIDNGETEEREDGDMDD